MIGGRQRRKVCAPLQMYPAYVSVYIELVIFNNLAVDLLLILSAMALRRRKCAVWRVMLAACVGSGVATAYPLLVYGWQIAVRVLLAPLMAIVFSKPQGDRFRDKFIDSLATLAVFILLTMLAGGVVYGLSFATGVDINGYPALGLVALACCVLPISARIVARKRTRAASTCLATLSCKGSIVKLEALCDSGNTLVDGVSGLPVVILSRHAEECLGERPIEGMIEVETVSGKSDLALIMLDSVEVRGISFKALGALTHRQLGKYDVILQGSMFR